MTSRRRMVEISSEVFYDSLEQGQARDEPLESSEEIYDSLEPPNQDPTLSYGSFAPPATSTVIMQDRLADLARRVEQLERLQEGYFDPTEGASGQNRTYAISNRSHPTSAHSPCEPCSPEFSPRVTSTPIVSPRGNRYSPSASYATQRSPVRESSLITPRTIRNRLANLSNRVDEIEQSSTPPNQPAAQLNPATNIMRSVEQHMVETRRLLELVKENLMKGRSRGSPRC